MRVLLTGGAGYIGSHTALVLLAHGHTVCVIDNFVNSSIESVRQVEALARAAGVTDASIPVIEADLTDLQASRAALSGHHFDAVIHCAGLKAVGESITQATRYYRTNLGSTVNLLEIIAERGVHRLVFSSSATVYGPPQYLPLNEDHPVGQGITSPYGWSKVMNEQIIRDAQTAHPNLGAVFLRYFNPVGAHPSGMIGEDPAGVPNNLMPFIAQLAVGKHQRLRIFGNTYPTPDGTGVRDYIHVMDLAEGHVAALEHATAGVHVYNLGTGYGTSVFQVLQAFERVAGTVLPYQVVAARPGDLAEIVADPRRANTELGWQASRTLDQACRDMWAWQRAHPNGFRG